MGSEKKSKHDVPNLHMYAASGNTKFRWNNAWERVVAEMTAENNNLMILVKCQ